jgi:methylmalonyl-CoA/ethylmalonyl-CoA epimerase
MPFLFSAPPELAFFDCNGVRLMLTRPSPGFDHPGSVLYFAVEDIQGMHDALRARGVVFRSAPHKIATLADREVWLADFEDTEGNTLALMSEPKRP